MLTSGMEYGSILRKLNRQDIHIALIILVGVISYANTMNVPLIMDDTNLSGYDNLNILEIMLNGGVRRIADITFIINSKIHGLRVTGYHLVNLTIHLLASAVLYSVVSHIITSLNIVYKLTEDTAFVRRFVPFAVAIFFVSHPVQTQAVTYIIQRYTSLATLFYLLSVLLFLKCRLKIEKDAPRIHAFLWAGASLAAWLLAMGSKQIAVTLPLMLLLIEITLFRGKFVNKRFFLACGTFFLIVLCAGIVKWHDSSWYDFLYDLNRATSEDHTASRITYFSTQTRVVATYLRLLCLPVGQSLLYDYPVYRTLLSAPVIASLALHTFIISTAFVLLSRSQKNLCSQDKLRGVLQRLASLGIAWFYVTLSVESSIFPIRDVIFEHRIYLPSIGFFMTVTAVIALITLYRQTAAWSIIALACIVLAGTTISRNRLWSDTLMFWQDTAKKAPNNGFATANLGGAYLAHDMPEKALPLFVRAINMNAPFQAFNLGEALIRLKIDRSRFTTGRELLFTEKALASNRIDGVSLMKYDAAIRNNLGLAYEYLGEPENARRNYIFSTRINPAYDLAWYNLGLLSQRSGDRDQAVNALSQLNKLNSPLAESLASSLSD